MVLTLTHAMVKGLNCYLYESAFLKYAKKFMVDDS